jgi:hypothetical protein
VGLAPRHRRPGGWCNRSPSAGGTAAPSRPSPTTSPPRGLPGGRRRPIGEGRAGAGRASAGAAAGLGRSGGGPSVAPRCWWSTSALSAVSRLRLIVSPPSTLKRSRRTLPPGGHPALVGRHDHQRRLAPGQGAGGSSRAVGPDQPAVEGAGPKAGARRRRRAGRPPLPRPTSGRRRARELVVPTDLPRPPGQATLLHGWCLVTTFAARVASARLVGSRLSECWYGFGVWPLSGGMIGRPGSWPVRRQAGSSTRRIGAGGGGCCVGRAEAGWARPDPGSRSSS